MTKMIKMSLIAAVAVTSMTSVASAQNLEDAIKGVDFSGNLRYRYTNGEANAVEQNEYQLNMTVKSKINDTVSATVSTSTASNGTNVSTSTGDADPSAALVAEAYFTASIAGSTVMAGKQALATPFADGSIDSQQGTGVVALVPVAGVTVAGGLFLNSDAKAGVGGPAIGDHNIAALAVIGKANVVDYALWYADVSEHGAVTNNAGATATNINLKAPVGPVNVEFNMATVDYSGSVGSALGKKEQNRLVVSGDVAGVSLAAGYVTVGKDGGDVTLGDGDSTANFVMEQFDATILKDTSAIYLAASAPVGPVTAKLEYGKTSDTDGVTTGSTAASETKLSVAYAMSKNFTISAWMTSCADALDGKDQNRLELNYTF